MCCANLPPRKARWWAAAAPSCVPPAPSPWCASRWKPTTPHSCRNSSTDSPTPCAPRPDQAKTTAMSQIPTLDIRRFDTDRDAFVAELGAAYREWGFAGIRGHGIPQADIDGAYDAFKRFFALPTETKMKYHLP